MRTPPPRHYRTWGRHLAVNDYAADKHLVVVGLLQYSAAQAEAMAMGAAGLEPDEFSLSKEDVEQFHLGEIAHHLFQAVGRGAIRKAKDGDVPEGCTLDIIFSTKGNASQSVPPDILTMTFPGARILAWNPVPPPLRASQKKLVEALAERAKPDGTPITLRELADASGLSEIGTVSKNLTKSRVQAEVRQRGIRLEPRPGKPMLVYDMRETLARQRLVGPGPRAEKMQLAKPKRRLSRARRRGARTLAVRKVA
jgi:hypothetical protein